MKLTDLQQKILKTLARFDTLNRPLTLLELLSFLDLNSSTEELLREISNPPLNKLIEHTDGYYYLARRTSLIALKNQRYKIYSKKIKIAQRASFFLKFFPWIRGIAVYSSLSFKNCRDESDIDLFFVTAPNRVWSARFFVNATLKLMRLRPSERVTKDRLCPSYFADKNHLNLSVANHVNDYYYYYFGPASFIFLYETSEIRKKFALANNWVGDILPNHRQPEFTSTISREGKIKSLVEKILSLLSEKKLQRLQLRILPTKYLKSCDGKKVILSDGIIKLHNNDKRENLNLLFEEKIREVIHA
ncbi:MAG: hypothetical protein BWY53_00597 [Parcubacteria group bacterium ADurb.Bin326]|nr:MAG: hypothetical protein BWY53_00597 [Parcubacteria group bacterium ADurb.Bin326]